MNTAAILFAKGQYNPGGISRVWYCPIVDIATMPAPADPATATDMGSLATLASAITCATGKQFQEIYCTLETGQVKCQMVGQRDGKGFENSAELSFPGNTALLLGFEAYFANTPLIIIVKEKNGVLRVIGDLDNPAELDTADGQSGQKIADSRRTVLTFKASSSTPAPIYGETIDSLLTPAS
jgi:hypothetical protein